MDCSKFKFKVEADFIEIRFRIVKPTNIRAIRSEVEGVTGRRPYVNRVRKGAAGETADFTVRIQDPPRWAVVQAVIDAMGERFPFADVPQVVAFELALDAYHETSDSQELARMVVHMYRGAVQPVSDNHRLYRDHKGSGRAIPASDRLESLMLQGYQIGIGNKRDPLYQHAYFKTTDNGGSAVSSEKRRARFEVRMQGAAIADMTLQDWAHARLTRAQCMVSGRPMSGICFRFREVNPEKLAGNPVVEAAIDHVAQLGERRKRNRRGGGTRMYSNITRADAELNEKARQALQNFLARWRSVPKNCAAVPATKRRSAGKACGFSGDAGCPTIEHSPSVDVPSSEAGSNNYFTHTHTSSDTTSHITSDHINNDGSSSPTSHIRINNAGSSSARGARLEEEIAEQHDDAPRWPESHPP